MSMVLTEGLILNVAMLVPPAAGPAQAFASVAKARLTAMTRAQAEEWAGKAIRFNAIAPQTVQVPPQRGLAGEARGGCARALSGVWARQGAVGARIRGRGGTVARAAATIGVGQSHAVVPLVVRSRSWNTTRHPQRLRRARSVSRIAQEGMRDSDSIRERRGPARRAATGLAAVLEIAVVLVLIVLNGLFALSELAVVSARRSRLRAMAQQGRKGADRALALAADPGRFLSTVQIGITAVGLIAGAYSGATLSADLMQVLIDAGVTAGIADWLAYVVVFSAITYLSLIIGELVPKNLALRNAESIACAVAPLMTTLSRVGRAGGVAARHLDQGRVLAAPPEAKPPEHGDGGGDQDADSGGRRRRRARNRRASHDLGRAAARRPTRARADDAAHRCRLDRPVGRRPT